MCSLLFVRKADISLKPISKEEAFALRKAFPDLNPVRTMRQRSDRGHFFITEYPRVLKFLENYWNSKTVERLDKNNA